MSRVKRLIQGLRRRCVFRVAVVYAAVAFVVWQAAEIAFPALNVPEWALTLIIVVTILGFPIALVLGWAFDITPEGVRGTDGQDGSIPPAGAERVEPATSGRKSIVVLPIDNMSPDPQDAYLSDGLTEEIISDLSCCEPLRVISRTSARALEGTQKDIRTIARELEVQYVLEGSVRKATLPLSSSTHRRSPTLNGSRRPVNSSPRTPPLRGMPSLKRACSSVGLPKVM